MKVKVKVTFTHPPHVISQLTDKQYEWTVLASLGKARKWKLIEEQLTGKVKQQTMIENFK